MTGDRSHCVQHPLVGEVMSRPASCVSTIERRAASRSLATTGSYAEAPAAPAPLGTVGSVSSLTVGPAARRAHVAAGGLAGGAAALYLRAVDPASGGWFPSCPLHSLTGLWCPACGMTRATHHLLNGELPTALRFNLLVVPALAAALAAWVGWAHSGRADPDRRVAVPARWAYVVVGVVAAFTVARNLPGFGVLRGLPA